MKNKKVVLAYSGGLDTSYCVAYLSQDLGLEVHAVTIQTGGFSPSDLADMEKRAYQLGAKNFEVIDQVETYYQKCIRYLLYGNVLRNHCYPLSVSAERTFQALAVAQYAQTLGADFIAHGSTGAGNDQVRFDLVFEIIAANIPILTPIRDQQLSRSAEIEWLQQKGFSFDWTKAKYSINQGLWGTSVGGQETLTSDQALPEEAFPSPLQKETAQVIELQFELGEIIGIDGQQFAQPLEAIQHLQALAAPYAIGRDTHVGDTVIGIKGRVGFEAAAPMILIKAHQLLEKHVLSKWQLHWKDQLANWYGMLLHEGQYLEALMRNIEVFLEDSQKVVSGKVKVKLLPYRFELLGIDSPYDLMQAKFAAYGEMNRAWSGAEVRGFTKILANAGKIAHSVHSQKVSL